LPVDAPPPTAFALNADAVLERRGTDAAPAEDADAADGRIVANNAGGA
jgi:hypothetical protein